VIKNNIGIGDDRAEGERLTNLPIVAVHTHAHFGHAGDDRRFPEARSPFDRVTTRTQPGLTSTQNTIYYPQATNNWPR